jgi:hypothetical protein
MQGVPVRPFEAEPDNRRDTSFPNPSTGALSSYPLNLAVPTGFKRIGEIEASKIVFASSTEILIRSLRF